jgi:hypothetical protein
LVWAAVVAEPGCHQHEPALVEAEHVTERKRERASLVGNPNCLTEMFDRMIKCVERNIGQSKRNASNGVGDMKNLVELKNPRLASTASNLLDVKLS